jgi:hypothetical protein
VYAKYWTFSIHDDKTCVKPSLISSISLTDTDPIFLTNLSCETLLIWKQSAADSLVKLFCRLGCILIIQLAISYLSFQSVIGTIILSGSLPKLLLLTIITGLTFCISTPELGLNLQAKYHLVS